MNTKRTYAAALAAFLAAGPAVAQRGGGGGYEGSDSAVETGGESDSSTEELRDAPRDSRMQADEQDKAAPAGQIGQESQPEKKHWWQFWKRGGDEGAKPAETKGVENNGEELKPIEPTPEAKP